MASMADERVLDWQGLVEAGNQAYEARRYSEAELKFAAALRIAEKETVKEELDKLDQECRDGANGRLAKSLNNMAALYHTQGKYSMAEDLYKRSLSIQEVLHGEEHIEVALNWHNLAALYSAKRRWAEAEDLYKRSLSVREKLLGKDHPDLLTLLNNYALLLKRVDRPQEAEELEARIKQISSAAT